MAEQMLFPFEILREFYLGYFLYEFFYKHIKVLGNAEKSPGHVAAVKARFDDWEDDRVSLEKKLENSGFDYSQIKEDARQEFKDPRYEKIAWDRDVIQINLKRIRRDYSTQAQP